jgi:glycosyltransferase involved in cell wall biosynthesis
VRFGYFVRRWECLATDAIMPTIRSRPWTALQAPFLVFAMLVRAFLLSRQHDVVHAHWLLPAGLIAAVNKRLRGVPFVLTVHGADAYTLRGRWLTRLKRWVLGQASAVFPVSVDIAAAVGLPPTSALPIGVDFDTVQELVGPRSPVDHQLLFIGRLAEKKGVDVLLRAMTDVPSLTLRIGGDGPDRSALEALSMDLDLDDRVNFLGRLSREQVMRELSTTGAVVVPSKVARDGDQDGTPVVMMEAVAAGVPVIASDLGGLGEFIRSGETGLLAAPDDPEDLAKMSRVRCETSG